MHIDSTDPIVVQSLRNIADLVIRHGGYINPDCTIHQRDENIWVSCIANAESAPVFIVPDALFVPVTHLEWIEIDGKIGYQGDVSGLSPERQAILAEMLIIYNRVDKLCKVAKVHPVVKLPEDPELSAWFKEHAPAIAFPAVNNARLFINTRLFGGSISDAPDSDASFLMPFLDYLNHHPYGPKYERYKDTAWQVSTPVGNGSRCDCFVRYGKADVFSIALWHGYFDPNTRHVAVLDCILDAGEAGNLRIIGTHPDRKKINAPRVIPASDGIKMVDIILEQAQLHSFQTLLGLALRSRCRGWSQAHAEQQAGLLITQIIAKNISAYTELAEICTLESHASSLRQLFAQVAEKQIALLQALHIS